MRQLTESDLRPSIVNGSRSQVAAMTAPADLAQRDWPELDYLGWRDPKAPLRGYLVCESDDDLAGLILRAAESSSSRGKSAMCELCRAPLSGDQVTLFVARRAGQAGRDLNTVGTYICADLGCSARVRVLAPATALRPDPEEARDQAIEGLRSRLAGFLAAVRR